MGDVSRGPQLDAQGAAAPATFEASGVSGHVRVRVSGAGAVGEDGLASRGAVLACRSPGALRPPLGRPRRAASSSERPRRRRLHRRVLIAGHISHRPLLGDLVSSGTATAIRRVTRWFPVVRESEAATRCDHPDRDGPAANPHQRVDSAGNHSAKAPRSTATDVHRPTEADGSGSPVPAVQRARRGLTVRVLAEARI